MERDAYTAAADARISALPPRNTELQGRPYEPIVFEQAGVERFICFAYVDFGDKMATAVMQAMKLTAATAYPGFGLAELPFECAKNAVFPARWQAYARLRRSVRGKIMFLDTDVICNRAVDVFEEDFDIGITDSSHPFPLMPFNAGVLFANDTPGAQMFMDAVMEYANTFATTADNWWLDQVAMHAAYLVLRDKIKIKIFPHEQFNYMPPIGEVENVDAYFVHLRGERKKTYVDYLRYAMERFGKRELVALPGARLISEPPVADPQGIADIKPNIDFNAKRGLPAWDRMRGKVENGRVAIVGYGPSLRDTWERLKDFDGAIWTTSKAHDFLLERGITPTFHTDLDYREHKARFNKLLPNETHYIIATQVHPSYLDRLLANPDCDLELFHSAIPYGPPSPGYPKVAPQFDVGLQAAYLAYRMGYCNQVWFGMDSSTKGTDTHAGAHGGITSDAVDILVDGRVYTSTAMLMRSAMWTELMLFKYPLIRPEIIGDGMLRPFLLERGRVQLAGQPEKRVD
jgi:hypothetical protein